MSKACNININQYIKQNAEDTTDADANAVITSIPSIGEIKSFIQTTLKN